ncbi:hypothetical protein D9M70_502210 [compost metagenome]
MERLVDDGAHGAGMLLQYPGHILQLLPTHLCGLGEWILRPGYHTQFFFAEAVEQQVIGACADGDAANHHVQLILQEGLHQYVAGVDLNAHRQARVAFFQGGDGARQQARGERRDGSDGDPAKVTRLQRYQFLAHAGQLGEDHPCIVDHCLAEGRRSHAARQALEQFDTEHVLGLVEHLGRRRLGHADRIGGPTQRAKLI